MADQQRQPLGTRPAASGPGERANPASSTRNEEDRHKRRRRHRSRSRSRSRSGSGGRRRRHHRKGGEESTRHKHRRRHHRSRGGPDEASAPAPAPPAQPVPVRRYEGKVTPVDESDYFRLNPEFCHYLVEHRQTYFGDLSGEEARSIFRDGFVHDYNSACLDAKYYEGMESGHTVPRTRPAVKPRQDLARARVSAEAGSSRSRREALIDERERDFSRREERRGRERGERKRKAKEQREMLDEMFPKATGRDALREKKAAHRSVEREREGERNDFAPISQAELMGGGDSFAEARAREARRTDNRARRREEKKLEMEEKLERHKEEEEAKLDQFRALLAQGPIKIRKRSEL